MHRGLDVARELHIALVSPFSWSVPSSVNLHVAALARELRRLGHLPVVLISSDERRDERRIPSLFHRARGQVVNLLEDYRRGRSLDQLLLPTEGVGPLERESGVPVVPLGSSFPIRFNGGVANLGLPLDITSRMEKLLLGAEFDLVHVHEPLAPSLSFAALRQSRSPVVATFHLTPLAVATYELRQSLLGRFFQRLDGRVVTFPAGLTMMDELYPAHYEVVPAGTTVVPAQEEAGEGLIRGRDLPSGVFALYVYRGDGRRSYRALLRVLVAAFPKGIEQVVVALHGPSVQRWEPRTIPRRLASRVTVIGFDTSQELAAAYGRAAVTILPFLGGEWLSATAAEAAVCGCPIVGPDLPVVRDCLAAGVQDSGRMGGAVFSPTESGSLKAAIETTLAGGGRLRAGQPALRSLPGSRGYSDTGTMTAVAERLTEVYSQTISATSGRDGLAVKTPVSGYSLHVRGIGEQSLRKRLRRAALAGPNRPDWINADLHIHSNFSRDCATPVETILNTAREIGLGAVAIADHNEIEGAFLARQMSEGDPFVIVAEEVKTAEGEVIGLFLREAIPPALSFDETLSLIKEQGGLVYVPHPFDALRATPTYRTLVDNLHRIDVIEVYNAKVALSSFNLSAERFAAKYNIVAGAGSDAHVPQGLGTAIIRMPRFSDPTSFMEALWEADIVARRKSLLYLQSLKLLQTTLDRVLPED
jgi:predicted metal-dependent phosphoesterase TrpH/glycosyltransferase involved in cell wall biosynthesis